MFGRKVTPTPGSRFEVVQVRLRGDGQGAFGDAELRHGEDVVTQSGHGVVRLRLRLRFRFTIVVTLVTRCVSCVSCVGAGAGVGVGAGVGSGVGIVLVEPLTEELEEIDALETEARF